MFVYHVLTGMIWYNEMSVKQDNFFYITFLINFFLFKEKMTSI